MDMTPHPDPVRLGRRGFRAGLLSAIPVLAAVGPFGLIFGIVAAENGLNLAATLTMSALVIAGASQLAALQVLANDGPALVAILTGAVVNLRMAMYSASLAISWQGAPLNLRALAAVLLHDQSYGLSIQRYRTKPDDSLSDRLGFFFGVGLPTSLAWIVMTYLGATLGDRLQAYVDLSFIVPVAFIAIAAPMLRGRANAVAAAVAATISVLLAGVPFSLGVMIGAAAGIVIGMSLPHPEDQQ
ncbi:MAG: AzlC family ABC transporter permease [Pseudomonadota bacterium]